LPSFVLFLGFFAAVALAHLTLLHLPYYWDEGGYYIPAALDFYHRFTLIPEYTNAHPPLPNVVLGTIWHVLGFHILVTRLTICAFAAAGLLAIFRMTQRLLGPLAAGAVTFLTAVYPIWFAQSTLAHADMFAAAFTLIGFALYLPETQELERPEPRYFAVAAVFSLAVMAKETAIFEPAILAAIHLVLVFVRREERRRNLKWLAALSFPLLPLLAWYAYHHHMTGFTFGNPEFLKYNATDNFTLAHFTRAFYYRGIHLFWQRNIWLPVLIALASLSLPRRAGVRSLTVSTARTLMLLIAGNWLGFSILGGALLTRYLLPVYPLILILCVSAWQDRTEKWGWLAGISAVAFIGAIWLNPPTSFAPEDNLTYRDMIVVHQQAIDFIADHYPDATVLTAWPASTELFRPELGYVKKSIKVDQVEDFTFADMEKAAKTPGKFDMALVFTMHYTSPALERYLEKHPKTRRGREFSQDKEMTPGEIAAMLGGTIVWHGQRDGEWADVIRFPRSYMAFCGECAGEGAVDAR
jgi:4-amino-4-deoxy-L-arabinose transferase-like glycosyltransferase